MLTCSSLDVEVKLLTEKQELDDVDLFQFVLSDARLYLLVLFSFGA